MKKAVILLLGLILFATIAEGNTKYARLRPAPADKNKDGVIDAKEKHMEKKREKKVDKNKDGVIDKDEINVWKTEKRKINTWWEKRADTNNDGTVDENELAAWKKLAREKMDLNGDGVIGPKEKRMCWRHAKSKVNTKVEKQYDANGDGWLEESEVKAMLKAKHEMIKSKGKAKADTVIEKEYDANKDGMIDSEEAKTMKEDAGK